jgi:hypothetical protein
MDWCFPQQTPLLLYCVHSHTNTLCRHNTVGFKSKGAAAAEAEAAAKAAASSASAATALLAALNPLLQKDTPVNPCTSAEAASAEGGFWRQESYSG